MLLVLRETAQGKTIANFLLGSVAGFSDLVTEILQKGAEGGLGKLETKFKVALNPMYRIFLNFAKSCISSCLSKVDNIKKIHHAVFEL